MQRDSALCFEALLAHHTRPLCVVGMNSPCIDHHAKSSGILQDMPPACSRGRFHISLRSFPSELLSEGVVSEAGDGATGDGDCTRHVQLELHRHQGVLFQRAPMCMSPERVPSQ